MLRVPPALLLLPLAVACRVPDYPQGEIWYPEMFVFEVAMPETADDGGATDADAETAEAVPGVDVAPDAPDSGDEAGPEPGPNYGVELQFRSTIGDDGNLCTAASGCAVDLSAGGVRSLGVRLLQDGMGVPGSGVSFAATGPGASAAQLDPAYPGAAYTDAEGFASAQVSASSMPAAFEVNACSVEYGFAPCITFRVTVGF